MLDAGACLVLTVGTLLCCIDLQIAVMLRWMRSDGVRTCAFVSTLFPVLALSSELACNSGLQFHIISVHLVRAAG